MVVLEIQALMLVHLLPLLCLLSLLLLLLLLLSHGCGRRVEDLSLMGKKLDVSAMLVRLREILAVQPMRTRVLPH
jgi:hypothetical protein